MGNAARALNIAVVGSGIAGMSAAWLLAKNHCVTLFESDDRIGGHSNTVTASGVPVDTGFIVYNELTYPNLTALFDHLGVPVKDSSMGFAVSLDDGRLEYAGSLGGLFAQARNFFSPRYWRMLVGLARFYRRAPRDLHRIGTTTLGDYLDGIGCGNAFRDDHLYPMAAAIWSTPAKDIRHFPAAAFIRFWENHGLLKFLRRPKWRTVDGGSREYVQRLTAPYIDHIRQGCPVRSIRRDKTGVTILSASGEERFDHLVLATHADTALSLLADPSPEERTLLGAFTYRTNRAILHSDPRVMPKRRRVWSSWNYSSLGSGKHSGDPRLSVTYWMNKLQGIPENLPLFVTLNPLVEIDPSLIHREFDYDHPMFDSAASAAQQDLWSLQGLRNSWFCGAYFGSGFHEDGLQSGLAVAEQLGGEKRPWTVADESGRIWMQGKPATDGWAGRPDEGEEELAAA